MNFRAGGRRFADSSRALLVALAVLAAIALGTAGVVLAETISSGDTSGYQVISGKPGDDTIDARNGHPDTIDCGAGNDTVTVDRSEDGVFDCETVITP
jgi:hypothetical protein